MYQVISYQDNRIEIALTGKLTADDVGQIAHHLESLSVAHPSIRVLFDATDVDQYEFRIALENYDFFKKYKMMPKKEPKPQLLPRSRWVWQTRPSSPTASDLPSSGTRPRRRRNSPR